MFNQCLNWTEKSTCIVSLSQVFWGVGMASTVRAYKGVRGSGQVTYSLIDKIMVLCTQSSDVEGLVQIRFI